MSGKSTLLRVGRRQRGAGAGGRAGARRRAAPVAAGARRDAARRGLARRPGTRGSTPRFCASARSSTPRAARCRCCSCSTRSCTAPTRTIGGSAPKRSCARWSERGAIGLVTTHDLALTELPSTLGAPAVNMHFEDRLENGRMVFDYRMRPGVVEHSNALALMRAIGLDV